LAWYSYFSSCKEFDHIIKEISFQTDNVIKQKYEKLNITNEKLKDGVKNFKNNMDNSFLFVVFKATEGFNDKNVDIVFNLDVVKDRSINLELQKIGRALRITDGKNIGIYVNTIPLTDNPNEFLERITSYLSNYIEACIDNTFEKNTSAKNTNKLNNNTCMQIKKYINALKIENIHIINENKLLNCILNKLNAHPDIILVKRNEKYLTYCAREW